MSYLAKNNAYAVLAAGISAGATSLTVASGKGDLFPVLIAPDYTFLTLEDAAGNREIVKATARAAASDVITITRAQEGTVARAWNLGDVVELRMTAALVQTAMAHTALTAGAHTAAAVANVPSGTIAATTVQAAIDELAADKEPAFATLPFSKGGTNATTRAAAVAALGLEAAEIAVTTAANATTDIGAVASSNIVLTTTATTITGFAAAAAGVRRNVRVNSGGFTMVNSGTFILPGAANIATNAGDCFEALSLGSNIWFVTNYQKRNGEALVQPPAGVTSVNGNAGAVTAAQIAAAAVTGLGYTPADSTHTHSGYVSTNMTHGAVGSLCFAQVNPGGGAISYAAGATAAGSSLKPSGWQTATSGLVTAGTAMSGTWRCLGAVNNNNKDSSAYTAVTLWQRIS